MRLQSVSFTRFVSRKENARPSHSELDWNRSEHSTVVPSFTASFAGTTAWVRPDRPERGVHIVIEN